MKNTILNQTEKTILAQTNFAKPSATNALLKMILWALRPVHYVTVRGHANLCKFDANIDAPEKSKVSFANDQRDDLADIQESISILSKEEGKIQSSIIKVKAKIDAKSGKKQAKAKRQLTELQESLASCIRKIGQNQELHESISKKLNKQGLLFV